MQLWATIGTSGVISGASNPKHSEKSNPWSLNPLYCYAIEPISLRKAAASTFPRFCTAYREIFCPFKSVSLLPDCLRSCEKRFLHQTNPQKLPDGTLVLTEVLCWHRQLGKFHTSGDVTTCMEFSSCLLRISRILPPFTMPAVVVDWALEPTSQLVFKGCNDIPRITWRVLQKKGEDFWTQLLHIWERLFKALIIVGQTRSAFVNGDTSSSHQKFPKAIRKEWRDRQPHVNIRYEENLHTHRQLYSRQAGGNFSGGDGSELAGLKAEIQNHQNNATPPTATELDMTRRQWNFPDAKNQQWRITFSRLRQPVWNGCFQTTEQCHTCNNNSNWVWRDTTTMEFVIVHAEQNVSCHMTGLASCQLQTSGYDLSTNSQAAAFSRPKYFPSKSGTFVSDDVLSGVQVWRGFIEKYILR